MKRVYLLKIIGVQDNGLIDQSTGPKDELEIWVQGNVAAGKYPAQDLWKAEYTDVSDQALLDQKEQIHTANENVCTKIRKRIGALNLGMSSGDALGIVGNAQLQPLMNALSMGFAATARTLIAQVGPALYPQEVVDGILAYADQLIADVPQIPTIEEDPAPEAPPQSEEPPAESPPAEEPPAQDSSPTPPEEPEPETPSEDPQP